jgi:alkylhydroperoxidase/carboxymuconolactone decarboxylase family protein YurZ
MNQVLVCLKKKNGNIRLDILDSRRKELVALGNTIRAGDLASLPKQISNALDAGASQDEIRMVAEFIVGDKHLFSAIQIMQKTLNYEESKRKKYISIVDDCKE